MVGIPSARPICTPAMPPSTGSWQTITSTRCRLASSAPWYASAGKAGDGRPGTRCSVRLPARSTFGRSESLLASTWYSSAPAASSLQMRAVCPAWAMEP